MFEMFKPMLAKEVDFDLLDFDNRKYLGSAKCDGIRVTVLNGKVYSRTKKLIPNEYVQAKFGRKEFEYLDGELIVGAVNDEDVYRNTNSGVMSIKGEPDVALHVFDDVAFFNDPFSARSERMYERVRDLEDTFIIPQHRVNSLEDIDALEEHYLLKGFEGLMLRDANMPYKFGRSTAKQQHLLKVKRFSDSEAVILGFDPLYRNDNEATIDALGNTVRSSHQDNKVAQELLGRLKVKDLVSGVEFYVGSGFTLKDRQTLWYHKEDLIGKMIKYKFFPVGMKDGVPRHPVFLGFRNLIDL